MATRMSSRSIVGWFVRVLFIAGAVAGVADAQPAPREFRVGHLFGGGRSADGLPPPAFRAALRDLGYVEGRTVVYESRFAEGRLERLPELVADLVRAKVDVILAQGGAATAAARRATSTVPIVIGPASGDAVALGMIASLARPGGNITGLTDEVAQLSAKRVELLREAVPKAARSRSCGTRTTRG